MIIIITEMRRFERYLSRVNPLDFICPPTALTTHYYTVHPESKNYRQFEPLAEAVSGIPLRNTVQIIQIELARVTGRAGNSHIHGLIKGSVL